MFKVNINIALARQPDYLAKHRYPRFIYIFELLDMFDASGTSAKRPL
jgi:hypothetical protein